MDKAYLIEKTGIDNVIKLFQSDDYMMRQFVAEACDINDKQDREYLSMLMTDAHYMVRWAVAEKGYGLDVLVNDESEKVRLAVAWKARLDVPEEKELIDRLVDDEHYSVRQCIAKKGYMLDKYVEDSNDSVRAAVAWACDINDEKSRKYLDRLMCDKSLLVRCAVAKKGYRMYDIMNGEGYEKRLLISERIEICKNVVKACDVNNPDHREILDILLADRNPAIRILVMTKNYKLEVLENDEIAEIREQVKIYKRKMAKRR